MNKCLILLFIFSLLFFDCSTGGLETVKQQIRNKEFDKALPILEKELKENNSKGSDAYFLNDEVYFYLGVIDCELENYDQGLQDFSHSLYISSKFEEEISAAKDHYFELIYNKALKEFETANFDSSLKLFQLSLEFNTDNPQAREFVRQAKQKLSESDSTRQIPKLNIQPDSSIAFYSGTGIQTTDTFSCSKKWDSEWFNDGIIFQI
ncbi:MAG TPA: hypothetical protein VLB50_11640, partial [Ignavibacteriaceae bacterium]|nr:hypothetical protein [Ignavibacteriaceae bacterium]